MLLSRYEEDRGCGRLSECLVLSSEPPPTFRAGCGRLGKDGRLDRSDDVERALARDLQGGGEVSASAARLREGWERRTHVADLLALRAEEAAAGQRDALRLEARRGREDGAHLVARLGRARDAKVDGAEVGRGRAVAGLVAVTAAAVAATCKRELRVSSCSTAGTRGARRDERDVPGRPPMKPPRPPMNPPRGAKPPTRAAIGTARGIAATGGTIAATGTGAIEPSAATTPSTAGAAATAVDGFGHERARWPNCWQL